MERRFAAVVGEPCCRDCARFWPDGVRQAWEREVPAAAARVADADDPRGAR
ncbi:hypothetical protein [Kitasatospora sp. NPDC018619]|uniref:hypothetical protein n=1 Tax=unclassified Kitasatospora TaxID=2633591 RepID=UPI0037BA0915